MKTRSKNLYAYLLRAGVLNGPEEDITQAKREYRRMYKQQWKQAIRPRKEIRIEVTLKQFSVIKAKAAQMRLPYTTHARNVILSDAYLTMVIPFRHKLLKVLQLISMASICLAGPASSIDIAQLLSEAETHLLEYLKSD